MHKAPRASTEQERLQLKAAVSRALKLAGGAASFQHVTRLHESNLSRAASPHADDQHLPLDVALDLDHEAQAPVILSELARLEGYHLRPRAVEPNGSITHAELTDLLEQSHKVVSSLFGALNDHTISPHEAKACMKAIDEQIKMLTNLRGRLNSAPPLSGKPLAGSPSALPKPKR